MILRKYNIFVYFIILLNLVVNVIIAQESTLGPSPAVSSAPTTTLISSPSTNNATAKCLNETACIQANDTLGLCDGMFTTPDKYIAQGNRTGTYRPSDSSLARCMCNQPYYDSLSTCIECFNNATKSEFSVSPLEQYKDECEKAGTTFTQNMPEINSGLSPKIKLGIISALIIALLGSIGFIIFRYYKRRATSSHKVSVGDNNPSTDNSKYPPPPSPSAHFKYQYAPPTDTPYYPPPPGGQYPPPPGQGEQYPPPPEEQHYPPPPQPQHYGGQGGHGRGGQSDSYYDSSF